MNLMELTKIAADDKAAENYLRAKGILPKVRQCPRCGEKAPYMTRRSSMLCRSCGHETGIRANCVLARSKLPFGTFLMLAVLFDLEVSALSCAHRLGVNRNTTASYYRKFREALAGKDGPDNKLMFGGKGKRKGGKKARVQVFGIVENNGKVKVEVVDEGTAKALTDGLVKAVKRGSLVYTDRYKSYDTLASYGYRYERFGRKRRYASGKVGINGIEGFWSYCKERLIKCRGVSAKHFPMYLAELQTRYNNRGKDFFDILMSALAAKTKRGEYKQSRGSAK